VTREGAVLTLWAVSEALNSLLEHEWFPVPSSGPGTGGDTSSRNLATLKGLFVWPAVAVSEPLGVTKPDPVVTDRG